MINDHEGTSSKYGHLCPLLDKCNTPLPEQALRLFLPINMRTSSTANYAGSQSSKENSLMQYCHFRYYICKQPVEL